MVLCSFINVIVRAPPESLEIYIYIRRTQKNVILLLKTGHPIYLSFKRCFLLTGDIFLIIVYLKMYLYQNILLDTLRYTHI